MLGLTLTSAILAKFTDTNGTEVIRPYTPVSDLDTPGDFRLVIKRYPEGKFGNHIFGLKPGDTVTVKGPIPKYACTPNKHKEITLIGGGSGITPLYQLVHGIAKNPEDKTVVNLFYGSKTEQDVLLRQELEDIQNKNPDQFKFHFFVDEASPSWKGQKGHITKEYLEKNSFKPSAENVHVFVCGPPPLYKVFSGPKVSPTDQGELTGVLSELGFSKDQVFKY